MQLSQQISPPKIFSRASPRQRLIAAGIFLAIAAFFCFFALMGHYKISPWPFPCGFKQRFHLPCPTCGVTTSVIAFSRGKILESFYTQPAAAFFCCFLLISAGLALFIAVSGIYFDFLNSFFSKIKIKYVIFILILTGAIGWVFTLAKALTANVQN